MIRENLIPRKNWEKLLENIGFSFHTIDDIYWDENACYRFEEKEIDYIEYVSNELHSMCLETVDLIIKNDWFDRLKIDKNTAYSIENSWKKNEPSIYGRFDFSYDGINPIKLLEYNADTPTSLFESSVVQWFWLKDVYPNYDQFNSIHEKLILQWKEIYKNNRYKNESFYFSCVENSEEDFVTTQYLRDTAIQANLKTKHINIKDIGKTEDDLFVDLEENQIYNLFKLYPWEWIIKEEFSNAIKKSEMTIVEPIWKMLLSNKAILAILWELFPEHPNLLPTFFDENIFSNNYVKKPFLSREGANIFMKIDDKIYQEDGIYGEEGYVYQQSAKLPNFNGNYTLLGSWIIGNNSCGISIREDYSPITTNKSRFLPHYFIPRN